MVPRTRTGRAFLISVAAVAVALVAALVVILGPGVAHTDEVSAQTAVIATIPVGGQPSAVGVNPSTNRIYVVNFFDDRVSVIDGDANSVIGDMAVAGPQGVGVDPTTSRIYVGNIPDNAIAVIDGASDTVVATVPLGTSTPSQGIAVNVTTSHIYVGNGASESVSVIDGSSNTVITTVPVTGFADAVAVNSSTNRIYVAQTGGSNVISVIDGASNTVIATVPVGTVPSGVAVNDITNRIYVADRVCVGMSCSGTVSVIDGGDNTVVATVPVGGDPRGVGVNPTTNRIYVADGDGNAVAVVDGATDTVITTVPVGLSPHGVGVNSTTNRIYVANLGSGTVSVIEDVTPPPPTPTPTATPAPLPCEEQWPVTTITTIGKGQSPTNNSKVSHEITAHIVGGAAAYGPISHRIRICQGTEVTADVSDTTGTPTNTVLQGSVTCDPSGCTVSSLIEKAKYKSVSSDGKDTDRITLIPVS